MDNQTSEGRRVGRLISWPFLVHEQLSVQILVVAGTLDRIDQLLGFDELITVSIQVVRFCHDTPPWGQPKTRVTPIWMNRENMKKPFVQLFKITNQDAENESNIQSWLFLLIHQSH